MASTVSAYKRQTTSPHDDEGRQRSYSISRALSVSYGQSSPSPLEHRNSVVLQPEELSLSSSDAPRTIPPVPLWMLLNTDRESGQSLSEEKAVRDLLFIF